MSIGARLRAIDPVLSLQGRAHDRVPNVQVGGRDADCRVCGCDNESTKGSVTNRPAVAAPRAPRLHTRHVLYRNAFIRHLCTDSAHKISECESSENVNGGRRGRSAARQLTRARAQHATSAGERSCTHACCRGATHVPFPTCQAYSIVMKSTLLLCYLQFPCAHTTRNAFIRTSASRLRTRACERPVHRLVQTRVVIRRNALNRHLRAQRINSGSY